MKLIYIITSAITLGLFATSCNKTHDKSYTSGTFTGETNIKEYLLVDDVIIEESYASETGNAALTNNDSLIMEFTSSIYSTERTFKASPVNIYEYVKPDEHIIDRFELKNDGSQMMYFGTRSINTQDTDTTRFYEINFIGKRN